MSEPIDTASVPRITYDVDCMACDLTAGRQQLPAPRVTQTSTWVVEPCVGPLEAGTLVVKPFRHILHVADLDPSEAAELGPLLRSCTDALMRVLQPSQVYVCLWSHPGGEPAHLHFVLQPVSASTVRRFAASGPVLQALMFAAEKQPATQDVVEVCDRLRHALRS